MAIQWFYQTGEDWQAGPVDSRELRRLAEAGIVGPETLVRQGAGGRWVRAEQVRGLFQGSTPAPSSSLDAAAVNEASEKPERVWPVTWAAIIVGSGAALLLLWALVFRGGSEPQQQAEKDQPPLAAAQSAEPRASAPVPEPDAKQHRPDANEEFSAPELYKRTSPSSIRVENYDRHRKLAASGSGFLVSPDGQVVTNLHVIRGADTVTVRLSSGAAMAVRGVLRLDKAHDLAVLDIGGSGHDYLQLSTAKPAVGTRVYAIGNPLGLTGTLSEGVVSGWPELDGVLYIQTTAAISHGSSGGPLLSADGTVVGITTAYLRGGQNLNLAIPASAIRRLLNEGQQPLSLAQVNAKVGSEGHQQVTIEDDPTKLAEVWKAIRAKKLGDALKMLEQIPGTRRGTGFWIATGHLHSKLRNRSAAQAAFGKAVATDPNNTEALLRLALALRFDESQRSWDTPRALCKRVIQLEPTNVPARMIQGLSTSINDRDHVGFFKTAAAIDPDDFAVQYNLGIASTYTGGSSEEAVQALEIAMELEKKVDLDDYLVSDSGVMGRVSSLTTSSTTESLHIPIKLALAQAYKENGQYERAVQVYKEVLAIEPKNPVAPWGICFTYRGWHNDHKHPDALLWENRAKGTDFKPAAMVRSYMPEIVYNYFDMLR